MLASHLGAPTSEVSPYPLNTVATSSPSLFPTTRGNTAASSLRIRRESEGIGFSPPASIPISSDTQAPSFFRKLLREFGGGLSSHCNTAYRFTSRFKELRMAS